MYLKVKCRLLATDIRCKRSNLGQMDSNKSSSADFGTVTNLSENSNLALQILSELRQVDRQTNKELFRQNMRRMGLLLAVEASKHLTYSSTQVKTPLGIANGAALSHPLVLACVLRAGLPLYEGILDLFVEAESAFVGAARVHKGNHESGKPISVKDTSQTLNKPETDVENSFDIELEYLAGPELEGKTLIVADPMLATGRSMVKSIAALGYTNQVKKLVIAAVVAAPDGIAHVKKHYPKAIILVGAIDTHLDARSYIIPGLGDAGDLAFGSKK
jgi:uracil phosphoribosyltransferase